MEGTFPSVRQCRQAKAAETADDSGTFSAGTGIGSTLKTGVLLTSGTSTVASMIISVFPVLDLIVVSKCSGALIWDRTSARAMPGSSRQRIR